MKKSRIIVPALAMIALSTAASIVGSVAWFTASRTTSISAGSFSVVKTSTNLECELTEGVGTYVDSNNDHEITLTDSGVTNVLSDGSFSHLNGNIYQPNEAGDGLATTNPEVSCTANDAADKLERGETEDGGKIYTAVTYTITFKVAFGSAAGDYGLFLDNTSGKTAFDCEDNDLYTAKGFRMAFYPTGTNSANGKASVLADLQEERYVLNEGQANEETVVACKYVASTSNFAGTAYGADSVYLIDSTYDEDLPDAEELTHTEALDRPDYLGKFEFEANAEVELEFVVVCWFDGNDPEIRNRPNEELQTVTSELHFEAIKLGA